jgi:crotonobetainyl-CoA:carnitine CoA-transferase CaiB-like acyl-CoA transferase
MSSKDPNSLEAPPRISTSQQGAQSNQAITGHNTIITGNAGTVSISTSSADKASKNSGIEVGYWIAGIVAGLAALTMAIYTLTGSGRSTSGSGQSGSISQQSSGALSPPINGNNNQINISTTHPGNPNGTQTPPVTSP